MTRYVGWAPNPASALAFIHQYGSVVLTPERGGWRVESVEPKQEAS